MKRKSPLPFLSVYLLAVEELNRISSRPTSENTFKVDFIEDFQFIKDIVFAQIFTRKYVLEHHH